MTTAIDTGRDWAVLAVESTVVVASDRDTALKVAADRPHLTVVSRAPGGEWEPLITSDEPTRYAFLVEGHLTSGTVADYAKQWASAMDHDAAISHDVRAWNGALYRVAVVFLGYDDDGTTRYQISVGNETATAVLRYSPDTDTPAKTEGGTVRVAVNIPNTGKGHRPEHANNADVRAAVEALSAGHGLKLADVGAKFEFGPGGDVDATVHGALIEPRGAFRVAVYWLEAGEYTRADGRPHATELEILADKLRAAGWGIDPATKTSFHAWHPANA
ncbi:hypothetical protein ACIA7S_28770 [Streptomyces sp. NPDC051643]|uniref:hypothetical protein n=1 Tax=Streptomyces sp. NPDC051643 TaxID=3365665 RepID=UPI00379E415B